MTPRAFPSFRIKLVLTLGLVVLADLAFWTAPGGTAVGAAALAWMAAVLAVIPAVWRDPQARVASAGAALLAAGMLDRPGVPAWALFWTALTLAVLLPRSARFDDVLRWFQRLAFHTILAQFGPLLDGLRLGRLWRKGRRGRVLPVIAALVLPVAGGALFLALFSVANPVIADLIARLRLPEFDLWRVMFWGFAAVMVWATLRPRLMRHPIRVSIARPVRPPPGVSVLSVTLSLALFNALFALQNGLDIAFLWSGARLPQGVTFAEYAHRGAYVLMATAILAGLFVLAALRPGTATAASRPIRGLVTLWVAQNVFLVASSILRTWDYVEAYSLTNLRIAALLWMGLVAVGLVLICWRLLRGHSAAWLVNSNAIAALFVLLPASQVDFSAITAAWNVRHAREVGGPGVALDLGYMRSLGPAALIPLVELEHRPLAPEFADRVAYVRGELTSDLVIRQGQWRSWSFRGQRRLARAEALLGPSPRIPLAGDRDYSAHLQSASQPAPQPAPLTSPPTR